jgi:hypothetical protein
MGRVSDAPAWLDGRVVPGNTLPGSTAGPTWLTQDGPTGAVVGSIFVGFYPTAAAYDNANGYIYVAENGYGSDNVTVISGATDWILARLHWISTWV